MDWTQIDNITVISASDISDVSDGIDIDASTQEILGIEEGDLTVLIIKKEFPGRFENGRLTWSQGVSTAIELANSTEKGPALMLLERSDIGKVGMGFYDRQFNDIPVRLCAL